MSISTGSSGKMRWIYRWISVLPATYFTSPISLLSLPALCTLPFPGRVLLTLYAVSQLLPALLAPAPALALLLACVRICLLIGLISVGHRLADARNMRPALLGLVMVYLTAVVFSQVERVDWLSGRLIHPYFTTTSLALAGAYGVWYFLFMPGHWAWKTPGVLGAFGVILASGSRGPLIAAILGVLAGLMVGRNRRWWITGTLAISAGAVIGTALLGQRTQIAALERMQQMDLTGRQVIWQNTLSVIRDVPLGGVGSYQLGRVLASPTDCYLLGTPDAANACPAWVRRIGQPWLIAHNGVLHQWAEAGPLGTLGLMILLGAVLFVSLRRRDSLAVAVLVGMLLTNIVDNTLIVPGLMSGELFWILTGTQLRHLRREDLAGASLVGTIIFTVLSIPIVGLMLPNKQSTPLTLHMFAGPSQTVPGKTYSLLAQFQGKPGKYLVSLAICELGCRSVRDTLLDVNEQGGTLYIPDLIAGTEPIQYFELRLYEDRPLAVRPIALYKWPVSATHSSSRSE